MPGRVYNYKVYVSLAHALLIAACLCAGCAKLDSLPSDWPLSITILPADAVISFAFSSQQHQLPHNTPEPQNLPPDKASKLEALSTHEWSVMFTTELTPEAYRNELEHTLKDENYHYYDSDAKDLKYVEEEHIRHYLSPDGKYMIMLSYVSTKETFLLTLFENVQPDIKGYQSATPLK